MRENTRAEQRQMMHVPWLGAGGNDVHRRAAENACAMCSPFGSEDGRTFPVPTVWSEVRRYLADLPKWPRMRVEEPGTCMSSVGSQCS